MRQSNAPAKTDFAYNRIIRRCIILSLLIPLIYMVSAYLMIGFTVVICILIFTAKSDWERMMYVLFFIAFANVMKFNRNMSSMSLLFEVTLIVSRILFSRKLPKKPIAGAICIGTYCGLQYLLGYNFTPTLYVKIVFWLFMMYVMAGFNKDDFEKPFILAFAFGQMMASIFGHFTSFYPAIKVYLNNQYVYLHGELGSSIASQRYCGLLSDSNLYSVEILITLSLLIYLFYRGKINKSFYFLAGVLIACSISSFSKTFFIGLALLLVMFVMVVSKKGANERFKAVYIIGFSVFVFFEQLVENLDVYYKRFSDATSIGDLTTNRSNLFWKFVDYLIENGSFFFGNGLAMMFLGRDALTSVGSHNAYIQIIYMLGIVGTLLAFGCFVSCYRYGGVNKFKISSIYQAIPLVTVLYGMMTVDLFQYDFFMITFILVLFIYKVPAKRALKGAKTDA